METKKRIVINPKLARMLLRQGYKIVDIEPNNRYPERTVFIFQNELGLDKIIECYQKS